MADIRDLKARAAEQKKRSAPTPGLARTDDRASKYAQRALEAELGRLAVAPEGTRNPTLNTAAFSLGQLVASGALDEGAVRDQLTAVALRIGLTATETEKTISSGLGKGMLQPRAVPEPTYTANVDVVDVHALVGESAPQSAPQVNGHATGHAGRGDAPAPITADEEAAFWAARPLLTHLHDFARARRVSPWAVLGVSLARIVTATPHQVCLPPIVGGKASLNLFVGLVGPSGAGKGAAEAVAADALSIGYIVSHNVGSGEGIAHGYKRRVKGELEWLDDNHAVLFSVPEIDSLAAQGDRKGATLMPQLRSGWTGEQLGFGYADPTKRILIEAHQYRLCLVAGIQPARAGCLLDDADAGTPQRFLWLPATDPDAPDVAPAEPMPITWEPPAVDVYGYNGKRIDVCDLATQTIIEARLARLRGSGHALDGHALLCQLKTAAALGILEKRYTVTEDDWALADLIARKSAFVRAGIAETLRAERHAANVAKGEAEASRAVMIEQRKVDNAVQRVCRAIPRLLQRTPGEWVTGSSLRRDLAARDRGDLEEGLIRLVEMGLIEADGHGRSGRYRVKKR